MSSSVAAGERPRIAVIGAGITGLVAAMRLGESGFPCDVYERWPGLGGQVATLDVGEGVLLERYYHHLFTTDVHLQLLYEGLGMGEDIEWRPSSVAMFAQGRSYPFTGPLDLLRFTPLPLRSRLRMGLAVVLLQRRHDDVRPFESMTAREWIERNMGPDAWAIVWEPLLRGKFGSRANDVSMAWLWKRLTVRRQMEGREARQEMLGYPSGSWEPLLRRMAAEIERTGGRVMIDRPAARIDREGRALTVTPGAPASFRRGHDPAGFDAAGDPVSYSAVLATVPNDVFARLLSPALKDELAPGYAQRLEAIEYHAALCLLLELDRDFGPYYWTNIADPALPFVGLIEQTRLVDPARYHGRRFLYVANYLEHGDGLLSLDADELLARYVPGLRRVNPAFDPGWVKERWIFREPSAQPIVTVGYPGVMPPLDTGAPGLILANTTQVYPEDRGTNYAVRLAGQAVDALEPQLAGAPV